MNESERALYRRNKREARRLSKKIERESRRYNRGEPKHCKHNRSTGREN